MKIALTILLIVFATSCGKFRIFKKSSLVKQDPITTGTLKVNVFYEEGAEPYTSISGALVNLPNVSQLQVFTVLQENLKAAFPGKTIIVPKDLSAMSKMSAKNKSTWSYNDIHDLGENLGENSAGDTTTFNIFFVKGNADSAQGGTNVIGLHLSGTKTMAIFKDVVEASGSTSMVRMYVEQATLVHEMGHGIGLVNNGLPLTSTHEDSGHHAHCSNPNCVMYWQNEGAADLVNFINSRATNTNLVMYDQACLKDVTSYKK